MLPNTPLNAQHFANDLKRFPLSEEGLQEKLNLLEKAFPWLEFRNQH